MMKLACTIKTTRVLKITSILFAVSFELISCSRHEHHVDAYQEVGYLMKDRTGIYFLQIEHPTGNIKQDLQENPEINAIKLVRPYDSLAEVKYPADTLTNLRDSQQGFRRSYSLVAFTPVSMNYKIDTTKYIPPDFKGTTSFPFEYDGGKATITYTFRHLQITSISLLKTTHKE